MFTIITPTYNRARFIERAFKSICQQDGLIAEWIIVDDGSSDDTKHLVSELSDRASYPVVYIEQANSGKHVALNKAISLANGRYTCILDSDDYLLPNACATMKSYLDSSPGDVIGIVGNCISHQESKLIGTKFPEDEIICSPFEIRDRYSVKGDKKGAMKTGKLKEFRFPEFEGERFLKEELVWNRVGMKYKYIFVNELFTCMDYQSTGLSSTSVGRRIKSIKGTLLFHSEYFELPVSSFAKFKNAINLTRFILHKPTYVELRFKWLFYCLLAFPLGLCFFIKDLITNR
ncbi:glycosyltransferase family A protein [Vibrio maritimus]|uniref:glycosyltransferase family A protein n=1 Tax=Vibrio maritimus TaxID=990268 RepID=UPI004068EB8D